MLQELRSRFGALQPALAEPIKNHMAADRRVELLIKGASDDLVPLVEGMRAKGWPVDIRADGDPATGVYTISVVVTVVPVNVVREERQP